MNNINAWTCGTIRETNTVIILTPEYYEDAYNSEKIARYNVDPKANYILTAYNPFEVAKDVATLVKKVRKDYSNLIIVGHSKAATINIALLNYLSDSDYDKIVNISGTHKGTVLTMPEKIDEICSQKGFLGKIFNDYYKKIFDGDEADQIIREDSAFLKQLDYSKINNAKFINIVAKTRIGCFFDDLFRFDF